jgi:hypothetical protein
LISFYLQPDPGIDLNNNTAMLLIFGPQVNKAVVITLEQPMQILFSLFRKRIILLIDNILAEVGILEALATINIPRVHPRVSCHCERSACEEVRGQLIHQVVYYSGG